MLLIPHVVEINWTIGRVIMNSITDDYPFVFVDPESVALFELSLKVAKTDIPVLITGPSGTGKEVIAHVIHESSVRSNNPFIPLNCAAIPEHLVEDTLFGHEKGAFTGANQRSIGFFEEADGGTLFLDEIGEMPIALQSKLLRVLQEKQIYRVGGTKPIDVDVRVVSATNINIKSAIKEKQFREDLYFRLTGFILKIKRLAERKADIEPLARIFVQTNSNITSPTLSREAIEKLNNHTWQGNVRELENVILRAIILLENDVILPDNIVFDDFSSDEPDGFELDNSNVCANNNRENVFDLTNSVAFPGCERNSELNDILQALKNYQTRDAAAQKLGMSTRTLRQKLQDYRKAGFPVPSAYARA